MKGTGRRSVDWADVHARLARTSEAMDRALDVSPERARATLEERARLLARVPRPASTGAHLEVLTFVIAGGRWATATRWVRTVMRLTSLTRLSGAPARFVGITSFRGEVLPIVDLRRALSPSEPSLADLSRVVVVGDAQAELGLLADEVEEVLSLDLALVHPLEDPARGVTAKCVQGVTEDGMLVLDGAALLAEPTLFVRERTVEEDR